MVPMVPLFKFGMGGRFGAGQHRLTTLGHEARHYILFRNRKLNELENREDVVRDLNKQLTAAAAMYLAAAQTVSKRRYSAARELQKLVEAEINQLAMKAQFRGYANSLRPTGRSRQNPFRDRPIRPLSHPSGGESRAPPRTAAR